MDILKCKSQIQQKQQKINNKIKILQELSNMMENINLQFMKNNKRSKSIKKSSQNNKIAVAQQLDQENLRKYSSTKAQRIKLNGKTYHLPTQYESKPQLSKLFPNQINTDKQKLYSELIILKRKYNLLEDDNHKLKTKLKIYEKQKARLMTQLDDTDKFNPIFSTGFNHQSVNLISNLKQQIRKEQDQNRQLLKQIQKMKKFIKSTKIKELEIQNQNLEGQLKRLLNIINQNNQNIKKNKLYICFYLVNLSNLKHQNKKLYPEINNQVILNYSQIIRGCQIRNLKNNYNHNQIDSIKQFLNQSIPYYQSSKQIDSFKIQLQNKQTKINQLSKLYYESKITKSKKNISKISKSNSKGLQLKVTNKKNHIDDDIEIIKELPQNIKKIGQFFNLKLRAHHIEKQQLIQFLLPYNLVNHDRKIKKINLLNVLATDPFQLNSFDSKNLFVQYLFGEVNTKNKKQQQLITLIGKRFMDILGQYTIDHINLEDKLFMEICEIVHNSIEKLAQNLNKFSNGQGTIAKEQLLRILRTFHFDQVQIKFILTQISLDSIDIDHLNYYSIFDLFDQKLQNDNQINAVQQLSQQYEASHSNTNLKKSRTLRDKSSRQDLDLQNKQNNKKIQSLQI